MLKRTVVEQVVRTGVRQGNLVHVHRQQTGPAPWMFNEIPVFEQVPYSYVEPVNRECRDLVVERAGGGTTSYDDLSRPLTWVDAWAKDHDLCIRCRAEAGDRAVRQERDAEAARAAARERHKGEMRAYTEQARQLETEHKAAGQALRTRHGEEHAALRRLDWTTMPAKREISRPSPGGSLMGYLSAMAMAFVIVVPTAASGYESHYGRDPDPGLIIVAGLAVGLLAAAAVAWWTSRGRWAEAVVAAERAKLEEMQADDLRTLEAAQSSERDALARSRPQAPD